MKSDIKDINEMTKKDFLGIKHISETKTFARLTSTTFNSLIILPTKDIDLSGFRRMEFVLVHNNKPYVRVGGISDVIHINGVGGFGDYKKLGVSKPFPISLPPVGWNIDCLKRSSLLRLFAMGKNLKIYRPRIIPSSFEIYAVERKKDIDLQIYITTK